MKKKYQEFFSTINKDCEFLSAHDFRIVKLDTWHYRVNERIDIWPTTKTAFDNLTRKSYKFKNQSLIDFVMETSGHICKRKVINS